MSEEAAEFSSEVYEALTELAQLGFNLNVTMSMIYQDGIDKGLPPAAAQAACMWLLQNLKEELTS